jgi:hypothetical protein
MVEHGVLDTNYLLLEIGALYRFNSNWETITYMWVLSERGMRSWKTPSGSVLLFLGEEYYSPNREYMLGFFCEGKKCYYSRNYSELFIKTLERVG